MKQGRYDLFILFHPVAEVINLVLLVLFLYLLLLVLVISKVFIDELLLRVDVLHRTHLDHLVIVSCLNLLDGFSLVYHNLKPNFAEVVHQNILLNDESNFR